MCNSYLSPQMASEPPVSYYAVFDGHAGKDAAAFAASHLHTVRLGYWDQFWREIQIQLLSFSFSASSAT